MKFLKERAKAREDEFWSHIKPEIKEMNDKGETITHEQFKDMRLNSYERQLIEPLLDDDAFIKVVDNALLQEGNIELRKYEIPSSYREAVLRLYTWELMRRLHASNHPKVPPNDIGATHWAIDPSGGIIYYKISAIIRVWLPLSEIWSASKDAPYTLYCFDDYQQLAFECGCRFENDHSNAVILCEECSKLPCHNLKGEG